MAVSLFSHDIEPLITVSHSVPPQATNVSLHHNTSVLSAVFKEMALAALGLLVIGAIPTVIGVAEAIDAQKKQNEQAKERIKFHMTTKLVVDQKTGIQEGSVVLKDGQVAMSRSVRTSPE